ncbi:hypothetical protein CDAR_103271 [Caerostris darwini]|uniref:Uncharacterized protein n=1 Tax=Caerostris darwini TaxID=1538125 RepID=A0AAV4V367_9ARAC|nr:hypothetical protein CDAR_103271 [Caerostris darwini]
MSSCESRFNLGSDIKDGSIWMNRGEHFKATHCLQCIDGHILGIQPITRYKPVSLRTVPPLSLLLPESSPDNSITSLYEGANWSQPSATSGKGESGGAPGRRHTARHARIDRSVRPRPPPPSTMRYEKGPLTRPLLVANKCLLNTFQNFSPASFQLISWAHGGRFPRENHSRILHPHPLVHPFPCSTFGSLGCTRNSMVPLPPIHGTTFSNCVDVEFFNFPLFLRIHPHLHTPSFIRPHLKGTTDDSRFLAHYYAAPLTQPPPPSLRNILSFLYYFLVCFILF